MEIKIKKAKIRDGILEVSYIDLEGNEITMKGKNKIHNDLRAAFSQLVPYFADLTEQKEADLIDWDNIESAENKELLSMIDVSGISIGGDSASPIITLTGRRNLRSARVLNLNSPGVDINSDTLQWALAEDFDIAVKRVEFEVEEYILHRKFGETQMEIDFDADPEDPFANVGTDIEDISIEVGVSEVA